MHARNAFGLLALFAASLTATAPAARAGTHLVAEITVDLLPGYRGTIDSVVDDEKGEITGFDYRDNLGRSFSFTLAAFRQGINVVHWRGMDILTLKGVDFDAGTGGEVEIRLKRVLRADDGDYRKVRAWYSGPGAATPYVAWTDLGRRGGGWVEVDELAVGVGFDIRYRAMRLKELTLLEGGREVRTLAVDSLASPQ